MPDSSSSNEADAAPTRALIARWRQLDWRDKRRLVVLVTLLPIVHLMLALFRYRRVYGWLECASANRRPRTCTPASIADANRLAELASIAGRRGAVAASCLRQSLIVWCWLRRLGLAPQIRIGSLGKGETFAAHAWVELEGNALAQRDLQHRPFA